MIKLSSTNFDYDPTATCEEIKSGGLEWDSEERQMIAMTCLFSSVSMAITSSVAIMMRNNKQLMAHPNKLIYYMCISEGIIAWQAMVSQMEVAKIICYFDLDGLLQATTFHAMDSA